MIIELDLIKENKKWLNHRDINKRFILKVIRLILSDFFKFSNAGTIELCLILSDDKKLREMNRVLRDKDSSTNVISVSYDKDSLEKFLNFENIDYLHLGDIAFDYEIIYNESLKEKKIFLNHFIHLLVHSVLHLLGHTHELEEDTETMQDKEIKILSMLDIDNPYKEIYE